MFLKSKDSAYDFLVVGLGNPGTQYQSTRHNAGFMAIDILAEKYGCRFSKDKFEARFEEVKINDKRVLLAKPQTYMNNSGFAVKAIASFYKIPIDKIIVLFDDISLEAGKIRLRRKGSAGGHNGIKHIIEQLASEDFMRIKIGVGAKPHSDYDLKDWVLGKFPKEQLEVLENALKQASSATEEIMKNGIDSAMNKYSK